MLSDPRLRDRMTARWADQFGAWLDVPAHLPDDDRARLNAARLLADGCWFADASGVLPIPAADRPALLAVAQSLVEGDAR
jgi:hypothetical protein